MAAPSRVKPVGNPRYNNARGAATLIGVPPFVFDGVVMRIFPLKASMRALRSFCDRYLNLMPKEIAYFEPAAPYVLLSAINYGRMGQEASNLGWVSQNEVVFSVLLRRSRLEGDQMVFEDFASVSPFIYVDDYSSMATGREVYGWPKTMAWLTPGINEWARHPESPQDVFVLSSMVFPELFAGKRQEPRVLLEIQRQPTPSVTRFPPDLSNPLNPLLSIPKAMIEGMSVVSDMIQAVAALPLQGYPADREMGAVPQMMGKATEYLDVFRRLPIGNTVNFKQFRDARDANAACYQAITTAPMTVVRYNGGGLLGDMMQLRGDPTGGFSLRVHRYPTQPIIESLGLEVDREEDVGDHAVATLKPYFPLWVNLDFNYGKGELVCWRTTQIGWRRDTVPDENPEPPSSLAVKYPYNTARGGATEAVTGPFYFPNVTQRVLPLLATHEKLRSFCEEYLDNDFVVFEPWGAYVYLIVTTFEEMASETYNVGWWASRQVTFSFPVRWYKRKDLRGGPVIPKRAEEEFELVGTGLVSPFAFTDSDLGATTGREVQGLPMVKAAIESPESSWLEDSGPARMSDLLRLSTNVYPGFNAGQKTQDELLLKITTRNNIPENDDLAWRKVAGEWGERLYAELEERLYLRTVWAEQFDNLRALSIELLRGEGGQPINEVSLRQFRDIDDPESACYQAITVTRTTIEDLHELREIEDPLHVAIHRYPNQPLVKLLGLRVKSTDASGSSVVDYLEPIRPFWMKVAMRVNLGEDIFWRAGSTVWLPNSTGWYQPVEELRKEPWKSSSGSLRWYREMGVEQPVAPRLLYLVNGTPEVATELSKDLDGDIADARRDLRSFWRAWRYPKGKAPDRMSREDAREAVGEDMTGGYIPPQAVIESLLEADWGRQSAHRSGEERPPAFALPKSSLGNDKVRKSYAKMLGFEESGDRLVHTGFVKELAEAKEGKHAKRYAEARRKYEESRKKGK